MVQILLSNTFMTLGGGREFQLVDVQFCMNACRRVGRHSLWILCSGEASASIRGVSTLVVMWRINWMVLKWNGEHSWWTDTQTTYMKMYNIRVSKCGFTNADLQTSTMTINLSDGRTTVIHLPCSWQDNFLHQIYPNGKSVCSWWQQEYLQLEWQHRRKVTSNPVRLRA